VTQLVTCDRYDPAYGEQIEAEPVVVSCEGNAVTLKLDDGGELIFDVAELVEAVAAARVEGQEAA
jgi:hypothetical protein